MLRPKNFSTYSGNPYSNEALPLTKPSSRAKRWNVRPGEGSRSDEVTQGSRNTVGSFGIIATGSFAPRRPFTRAPLSEGVLRTG